MAEKNNCTFLAAIVLLAASCSIRNADFASRRMPSTPETAKKEVVINIAGDVRLDGYISEKFKKHGAGYPFEQIKNVLEAGDINCVNLECVVSSMGEPMEKKFCFRAEPESLCVLTEAGINLVNLANNHSGDYGDEAFADMLERLKGRGIKYVGAGMNLQEARTPLIIEAGGRKIAFLGFGNTLPKQQWAGKEKPGITPAFLEYIKNDVKDAVRQADFTIVIYHGGDERSYYPKEVQHEIAHTAIEAGADAVIGHHPHVLQGFDVYKGKIISYSLGNFLFLSPDKKCYETGMFQLTINDNGAGYRFFPLMIGDGYLRKPKDSEKEKIFYLLKEISAGFNVDLELHGEKIEIEECKTR